MIMGEAHVTVVAIARLRRDGGTQPRDHVSMDVAKEYAEALADGAVLPAVTAFYDGTDYWLADGFHRVIAHELVDLTDIEVDVRQGTRREAILFSVGANASHGYRRSNMDKRRAVLTLLNDPEWQIWSDREIARQCSVGPTLVNSLRPKSALPAEGSADIRTFLKADGTPSHMRVGAIGKAKPEMPVVAGYRTERAPDLSFATCDEAGVSTAARITGLSERNVMALARAGEIDGARKDGAAWVIPTAPLQALVQASVVPEPTPRPAYDPELGELILAISDTVEVIGRWPSVDRALAIWADSIAGAPNDEAIAAAGKWMAEFAAGWPAVSAARAVRIENVLQEIQSNVVE